MKVKDLILELQEIDPEAELVMASDPEGNDYNLCSGVGSKHVLITNHGHSTIKYRSLTPELKEQGYTEEDCYDPSSDGSDALDCYVLWPE